MHALIHKMHEARDYDAKETKKLNEVANEIYKLIDNNPQEWINAVGIAREETKDEIRRVNTLWEKASREVFVYSTQEYKARAWDAYWDYIHARMFRLKLKEIEDRAFAARDRKGQ